jgi:hypothetical protein
MYEFIAVTDLVTMAYDTLTSYIGMRGGKLKYFMSG